MLCPASVIALLVAPPDLRPPRGLPARLAGLLCAPVGGGPPASRPRYVLMLVAPLVFRAPSGPAAREARRPHFVRRRASKPARALRSLRRPPHQWGWVAGVWFGASSRSPARPRRPRGGLQSGGAWGACACSGLAAAHRHRVSKPALVLPSLTVARCGHCLASPDACASPPSMPGH